MPNPTGRNGFKPAPPEAEIRLRIERYVQKAYSNPDIEKFLRKYYDTDKYNVSVGLLKKLRGKWNLPASRGQAHTLQSISAAMQRVHKRFPSQGSHAMKYTLLDEERISVPRKLILEYARAHWPDEVRGRKSRRLKRNQFWCAGVNDIWCLDQHDKWRRFELFAHVCVEPYSGRIIWLKIWWTNRNPRLVCGFYCDSVAELGGMPMRTQSDHGSENNGVANGHTTLRRQQDTSLTTKQHRFMGSHCNVKPEIFWRIWRQLFTPGFERILDWGVINGLYDADNPLERMVFHRVFIPWLQEECDRFRLRHNSSKPRFNRHKVLPHGRPDDIAEHPELFGTADFKIEVVDEYLDDVRETYAPPDHDVFRLTPSAFEDLASQFLAEINPGPITMDNVWDVYADLLGCFRAYEDEVDVQAALSQRQQTVTAINRAWSKDGPGDMPLIDLPPLIIDEGPQGGFQIPLEDGSDSDHSSVTTDHEGVAWTDDEEGD